MTEMCPGCLAAGVLYAFEVAASAGAQGKSWADRLKDVVPGLNMYIRKCPQDHCYCWGPLYKMIQHLNDSHELSREEIADWLETLDVDLTFHGGASDGEDRREV
jgi:hypothetical protein